MVPTPGLEPGRPYRTRDFKSLASTYSAKWASIIYYNKKNRITLIIIFCSIFIHLQNKEYLYFLIYF